MTEPALHLHAGFLQHEHVQTFALYVHEEVQLMLSEVHARVQHKTSAQRQALMKACLLHFRNVTDSQEREESARILQRHDQFDALMEITIYFRDNYDFVGAIRIDYRFYRGPVPHSQITPAPIGAAAE